jgi:hypothetical protein
MSRIQLSTSVFAGALLLLLLSTPNFAQQVVPSAEPPQSVISLAPAPRPQGQILARNPGDATFGRAPATYHVFAAASVGKDAGVEALTLNFAGETRLTRIESKNKDFVIEAGGTCHEGNIYSRGGSCSLLVRFNPQGPGHRLGFINVSHTADAKPMSFGLTGNGYSPVVSFTPSQITTVAGTVASGTGTIKSATNMAMDGGDIVYIADIGNNIIKEMDSSGIINTISPAFATPASLAVDSLGILYSANVKGSTYYFSDYTPWGGQSAYGYAYAPGSCTPSAPCALSAVGMSSPASISMDAYDDLFFEEATKGAAEMPVTNISGGTGILNLWYLRNQYLYASSTPASFAVDAAGNLYNSYNFSTTTCFLMEESLYSAEYSPTANRVAGGTMCGFTGDGGQARGAQISSKIGQIAFDAAGNLYFADTGNQRVRRIDALTGIINTIAGNGTAGYGGDSIGATQANLSNPSGVAVDSQGQVYILSNAPTAGPTQVLRKVGTTGRWYHGALPIGSSSPTKVFTVANTGNETLTLAGNYWGGTNVSDFHIDAAHTTCSIVAGATLMAGRSCNIGIGFKPSAFGARSAALHLLDNTVTGDNVISLSGIGQAAPTMTITSPTAGTSVKAGTTVTFTVNVTASSTPKPTGSVNFKVNGTSIGTVTLNASGSASHTFSEPTANTYALEADYNGDSYYTAAVKTQSLTVAAVKLPAMVSLVPAVNPLSVCGGVSFSVQVSSVSGAGPTGSVQLMSGTSTLTSADLTNGAAVLSAGALASGTHSFTANYSGDSLHAPATSALVTVTVPSTTVRGPGLNQGGAQVAELACHQP